MFKALFDLSYQRTKKEAFGFYLAYLGMILLVLFVVGPFIQPDSISEEQLRVLLTEMQETKEVPADLASYIDHITFYSRIFALIVSAGLSLAIAMKKNIFKERRILGAVIGIIIVGYFMGPIISLMGIAWLTTQDDNSAKALEEDKD